MARNAMGWECYAGIVVVGAFAAVVVAKRALGPNSLGNIPKKMKQLRLVEPNMDLTKCKLEVAEVDVPVPGPGQVLVKMAAAPMNPSDYNFLRTKGNNVEYPAAWGNEGSGTVVATGGGLGCASLLGKAVAVMGSRIGTFGEYVVTSAITTHPLPADMDVKDGCGFTVNPWTALAMAKTAKKNGGVFINTAAGSALGKMLTILARKEGLTMIAIVRSPQQAALLKNMGAQHVLVSPAEITDPSIIRHEQELFVKELKDTIKATKCKIAFDCIGGYMTGLLLSAVPYGGTVYVYGRMAPEACSGLEPLDLIYRNKQVKGFFLGSFMKELGFFGIAKTGKEVAKLMMSDFRTDFIDYTLNDATKTIADMAGEGRSLTSAKARIVL